MSEMSEEQIEATLRRAQGLVTEGTKLLQSRQPNEAKARFEQAAGAVSGLPAEHPGVLVIHAAVHDALGVLAGNARALEPALRHHQGAIVAREKLLEGGKTDVLVPLGVSHLNLANLLASGQKLEEAEQHARAALARLDAAGQVEVAGFFKLGACQLLAVILAGSKRQEEALQVFEHGIAQGQQMLQGGGNQQVAAAMAQLLINASILHHQLGRHDFAVDRGTAAAGLSKQLADVTKAVPALEQYVAAQMNLVTFNEAAGRFGAAEDALFRVLELLPSQPQVLERGRALYTKLLTLTDEALEAGNLPRDEVEESLAELERMAAAAPAQPDAQAGTNGDEPAE